MDNSLVEEGPWRATRLWNSIVKSLHEGIPRKKHRKHLRTYEDCFTANEALDWLHRQLKRNPNFGSDVSKEQTVLLLQKLSKAGVIVRLDEEISASNSSIKTPASAMLFSNETFKAGGDLYRLAPKAESVLHTPGKKAGKRKSEERSRPLSDVGNTPLAHHQINGENDDEFEEKPGLPKRLQGIRSSFRKIKNKHRDLFKDYVATDGEEEEEDENTARIDQDRDNLNLSYLQSLPANSLVVLDNDRMWREVFDRQLRLRLSDAHISSLEGCINVNYIIHNMTKVSEKGIVQLSKGSLKNNDLPRWTLSAMKCLANWPKPFQSTHGSTTMPYYQGFEIDVFNVVKDYFTSLTCPLITFDLFDIFVSAFIKAEAVSALRAKRRNRDSYHFAVAPMPYMETDFSSKSSSPSSGYFSVDNGNYMQQQRYANIRPTLNILPRQTSSPIGLSYLSKDMSSPTAIMRNFLPPNTCFETAFMDENPVTRIVPQRGNEILHHLPPRAASRTSVAATLPLSSTTSLRSSVWDSRSIATQTSDEEEMKRKPRWKRSSRQRKSIAVMETNQETMNLTRRFRSSSCSTMRSNSMENVLDSKDQRFLQKYNQFDYQQQDQQQQPPRRRYSMASLPTGASSTKISTSPPDNMILSKTVRKEKRKQRERRSLDARHMLESPVSTASTLSSSCYHRSSAAYQHLSIKTPMHICGENAPIPHMDEGMSLQRAEPFNQDNALNREGQKAAIEAFQLLGLLLPPDHRRKLQLLLKFMRRVGSKEGLSLTNNPRHPKSCHDVVVETFSETILRPKNDLANYDEEVCRKIICFFMDHFEEIWSPSLCLRKEVEERVYQSLVNKRIEDGLDPYPVTFCTRVPSKVYEKEKVSGVQAAMLDLLEHTLNDKKMSQREKRKKLKKFKAAYPDIFAKRFPTPEDEPDLLKSMSSLTRFKSVMRI